MPSSKVSFSHLGLTIWWTDHSNVLLKPALCPCSRAKPHPCLGLSKEGERDVN